nr:hypothetical protein [uncultured Desulfobacter sp.]
MLLYITNLTTADHAEIKIINHNHESKLVKVISNILRTEPYVEKDSNIWTITLTSQEINILYEHAQETPEDLARIIDVEQLNALRGIKGIDY